MKLKIATLVTVLALAASSALAAGTQWIAINGGAGFPSSDLSDAAETGWLAGAGYGYGLNEKFALGAEVNYNGLGKKTIGTVDVQPTILQYSAEGYWMIPMSDKSQFPYLKVGAGGYNIDTDVAGQSSKTKFGANAGLGWNKALKGKTSFGLDGAYHWISSSSDFKNASGDDASLSYFTLSAHVGWSLGGGQ
jgi:opacity protein-like surface antigen